MKKILQNLTIIVFSLLASFGACEVVARIMLPPQMSVKATSVSKTFSSAPSKDVQGTDGSIMTVIDWSKSAERGIRLYPNVNATIQHHTLSKQEVVLRINSIGMRGPQLGPKEPGEFRVLNIGDSITFGDYLDESLTIPHLIQEKLGAQTQKVLVLNAGLPGSNAADEYYHYLELQEAVQPDLVLVGLYLNDAQDSKKFYARTLRFPFSQSRFLTWVAQRFQLIDSEKLFGGTRGKNIDEGWREKFRASRDLKSGNMLETRDGFDFEIYNAHKDFGLAWNSEGWAQLAKIIGTFAEIARQNGQQFAAYLLPIKMQVYANTTALSTVPQDSFLKMCKELSIPCLDLLPALRSEVSAKGIKDAQLFYDHCHYKELGNRIVADTVAAWLSQGNLLSPRRSPQ